MSPVQGQLSLSITFSLQYCECAGISKLTPVNREDIILFRPLALVMFNPTFSPDSLCFGHLCFFAFLFIPQFLTNCNLSATTICHLQFLSSSLRIFFSFFSSFIYRFFYVFLCLFLSDELR